MNKSDKIKVGISIGDFNGIGIEIILKTFSDKRMFDFCTPVVFANNKLISAHRKLLNLDVQFQGIKSISKLVKGKLNILNIWNEDCALNIGKSDKLAGKYALKSLESATESLKKGEIDILVTAPINKDNIQSDNFRFPGHTEFLESKLEGKSLMILMTDVLKIGLVTGHIPIAKVSKQITAELIEEKVRSLSQTLIQDFGVNRPKIAVLGLNPHCGDNGVIGNEDNLIVKPTIEQLKQKGVLAFGPFAADSFFGSDNYKKYDAILAMYHDQGLGPFKTIAFGEGVNYTSGLNKIRTSPDHGTAYNIAGKGLANTSSFKEAIFTGISIFNKRELYKSLIKNQLKINKDT
ncbi:MAG: 4-hydroxythreonine-4-phosphate dehydrogenase PdxA [Lutibacter sp.]